MGFLFAPDYGLLYELNIVYSLQDALCCAYVRICRTCPPHVWKPESLICLICSTKDCYVLQDCFKVALSVLGPDLVGGRALCDISVRQSPASDKLSGGSRSGSKRSAEDIGASNVKRKKAGGDEVVCDFDEQAACMSSQLLLEQNEKYASDVRASLLSYVEFLKPSSLNTELVGGEVALTALSTLCIVFCKYPITNLSLSFLQLILLWIPWIHEQVGGPALISIL